ncbi:hypothetical protein Tco_0656858 [Tanacetum coccineum]|uniref:Uncharacterized protein n=1 Tax=Tanacetum coccineum TaxID=301880 RepID=A0ABQ4X9X9_9ASTR
MRSVRVHLHPLLDILEVLGWIMVLLPLWMMKTDVTERNVRYGLQLLGLDMVEEWTQMRYMGDWMMHRMIGESTRDYSASLADRDFSLESSTPRSTGTACGDTKTDEYTADTGNDKPGVTDALAARDANRNTNGDDNHFRISIGLACSFMLCDLDFEPLSLSLSSLPSCDLVSFTNILILCLILKASNQSLRKSLSLNLELS